MSLRYIMCMYFLLCFIWTATFIIFEYEHIIPESSEKYDANPVSYTIWPWPGIDVINHAEKFYFHFLCNSIHNSSYCE